MNIFCFSVPPPRPELHANYWAVFEAMARSAQRAIQGARVILSTSPDAPVPESLSIDRILRFGPPSTPREIMVWRLAATAQYLASGFFDRDSVLIDQDLVFLDDPRHVFAAPFDLALTWREVNEGVRTPDGHHIWHPVNAGVIFCRHAAQPRVHGFFAQALSGVIALNEEMRVWYGDQEIFLRLIGRAAFARFPPPEYVEAAGAQIRLLPGEIYNFTYGHAATVADIPTQGKSIIHFKGARKPQMLEFAAKVLGLGPSGQARRP